MKIITKPTYKCDFCSKLYQRKHFAEQHEIKCKKNPDNFRICHECAHLNSKTEEYFFDTGYGEDSRKVKVFYCDKIKTFLHPASVEHSEQGAYELGYESNEPMKKECEMLELKLELTF